MKNTYDQISNLKFKNAHCRKTKKSTTLYNVEGSRFKWMDLRLQIMAKTLVPILE